MNIIIMRCDLDVVWFEYVMRTQSASIRMHFVDISCSVNASLSSNMLCSALYFVV